MLNVELWVQWFIVFRTKYYRTAICYIISFYLIFHLQLYNLLIIFPHIIKKIIFFNIVPPLYLKNLPHMGNF